MPALNLAITLAVLCHALMPFSAAIQLCQPPIPLLALANKQCQENMLKVFSLCILASVLSHESCIVTIDSLLQVNMSSYSNVKRTNNSCP